MDKIVMEFPASVAEEVFANLPAHLEALATNIRLVNEGGMSILFAKHRNGVSVDKSQFLLTIRDRIRQQIG